MSSGNTAPLWIGLQIDEPRWIEFNWAIALHDEIVRIYGSAGFPHPGYLDSALNAAKNYHHYSEDGGHDLYDLAAIYLYHIAKAHAFTDGNKRTAYVCAIAFLYFNGIDVRLPRNTLILAKATERAVKNKIGKVQLAQTMRVMPKIVRPRHRPSSKSRRRKKGKRML